mgnify:CR=1 FL=1
MIRLLIILIRLYEYELASNDTQIANDFAVREDLLLLC